ncbi:O-antigen ligase family protein [Flavobacterium maritimum]|uniref:O-antigen ligase family protein n=1 Tax=Flavobacterium maritimum TaxID=3149042 RepID=UPI0032B4BC5E
MKNVTLKLFPVLLSFLFTFPILKESLSSFVVILVCLNTIIYKISVKDYRFLEPKTILLTIPFWIILINSIFSTNFQKSIPHIQHALFFLIIPIFFSLIPKEFFNTQKINLYITVLKITCLLIAIIYVISFFINFSIGEFFVVFQNVSSFRNYIYYNFNLFRIHPTYYTTLLILCSAHSFELVLKEKKYTELIYIICFLLISFLLLTRLNIVLLVAVLIIMLLSIGKIEIKKKLFFLGTLILFAASLSLLTPGIKDRFVELYQSYNKPPVNVNYDSTNIRKAIFDCSIGISKENLLYGVGFENLQTKLNECYGKNYESSFYESHNYLTHNYYFYILVSSGVIGLFFFVIYLLLIIKTCLKTNLFLFYVFLFDAMIVCFIEDYLYRQYGVLYFNLLLICFIQYYKNIPPKVLSQPENSF